MKTLSILGSEAEWKGRIAERFEDRQDLGSDVDSLRVWHTLGVSPPEVRAALEFLHGEFGVAPGRLRPEDDLALLFRPVVPVYNPLKWLSFRGREAEIHDNFVEELHRRTRSTGLPLRERNVSTVADFVCAWCGREPEGGK